MNEPGELPNSRPITDFLWSADPDDEAEAEVRAEREIRGSKAAKPDRVSPAAARGDRSEGVHARANTLVARYIKLGRALDREPDREAGA